MKYKIYILNSSKQYKDMFLERDFELTDSFIEADLVQFTGGADVSPKYYRESENPRTDSNPTRDKKEAEIYNSCIHYKVPMTGICRGGQFLSVMNGGKMWQHVDGHALNGTHPLLNAETKEVICEVSSTHHQMMRPFGGLVLAIAREATFLEDADNKYGCKLIEHEDTEVVWFPKTKSLCFQPHPEFNGVQECRDYYFELLHKYILTRPPKAGRTKQNKIIFTKVTSTTNVYDGTISRIVW